MKNYNFRFLGDEGVYQIRKYNTAGWSPVATDVLVLDLYGSVLLKEFFSEKPLNVQFASLIKPIHTGEIFGIFSKWIYFIACLIATSLPVTGTLIWWISEKRSVIYWTVSSLISFLVTISGVSEISK